MSEEGAIRVLHVDDNENDLYLFKRRLTELDRALIIDWAFSAEEALEKLNNGKWDCLLADHEMPGGMNGLDLLKTLRETGINIPFIYITGQGNEQIAAEAFRQGAADYFSKNFDFAYFHRILNSIRQSVSNFRTSEEQRKAEELMKQLNFERERILSNVNEVIWSIEIDENLQPVKYLYLSPAIEKATGFSIIEFYNDPKLLLSRLHPDDVEHFLSEFKAIIKGKQSVIETRFRKKDGSYNWTRARIFPEIEKTGRVRRIQGITSDIQAQKEAELLREASEKKYQTLFDMVPMMIIISTVKDGVFIEVNDSVLSLTGYSKDEFIGKSSFDLDIWVDPSERSRIVEEILKKGYTKGLLMNLQLKNGQKVEVITDAVPITYDNQECLMMIVRSLQTNDVYIDEYQKSEDRYRFLLMNSKDGILVLDKEGKIFDLNKVFAELLGFERFFLLGKNLEEIIVPEQKNLLKKIFQKSRGETLKIAFKTRDGLKIEADAIVSVHYAGDAGFAQMIIRNIPVEGEKIVTAPDDVYCSLIAGYFRYSPDIVYIRTASGQLKAINEKFSSLLNILPEDISNKPQKEILPHNLNSRFEQSSQKWRNSEGPVFFIANIGVPPTDGAFHFIEFPLPKTDSEDLVICGIGREISDFYKPDEKIRMINAELDEFVHKVSHDLKAPIRNVIGYIEMALNNKDDEKEYLQKATDQCIKLQLFISKLLELSKAGRAIGNFQEFNSELLVKEVYDLLRNQSAGVELKITGLLPDIYADRTAIFEVFQNLIVNAVEHSDKSKTTSYVNVFAEVTEKECIFTIEDNGKGMDKPLINEILHLDYNLNEGSFKKLGFGLPISRKIIDAHHGRFWVDSVLGQGSSFHFSLPFKAKPKKM